MRRVLHTEHGHRLDLNFEYNCKPSYNSIIEGYWALELDKRYSFLITAVFELVCEKASRNIRLDLLHISYHEVRHIRRIELHSKLLHKD